MGGGGAFPFPRWSCEWDLECGIDDPMTLFFWIVRVLNVALFLRYCVRQVVALFC